MCRRRGDGEIWGGGKNRTIRNVEWNVVCTVFCVCVTSYTTYDKQWRYKQSQVYDMLRMNCDSSESERVSLLDEMFEKQRCTRYIFFRNFYDFSSRSAFLSEKPHVGFHFIFVFHSMHISTVARLFGQCTTLRLFFFRFSLSLPPFHAVLYVCTKVMQKLCQNRLRYFVRRTLHVCT